MKLVAFAFILSFGVGILAKPAMKGWEIYRWLEKSETRYALLPGTNRLKTESEILQTSDALDLKRLLRKLKDLEPGEYVMLEGGGLRASDSKLTTPSESDKKQIFSICRSRKLKCSFTQ